MIYDPNVYGYVDGRPTYSRDEFIYKKRLQRPPLQTTPSSFPSPKK